MADKDPDYDPSETPMPLGPLSTTQLEEMSVDDVTSMRNATAEMVGQMEVTEETKVLVGHFMQRIQQEAHPHLRKED